MKKKDRENTDQESKMLQTEDGTNN